jgi:hypothetical protein
MREPNLVERERAMGYATGTTDAPNVTCRERHVIFGGAIDSYALSTIFSLCRSFAHTTSPPQSPLHNFHSQPPQPTATTPLPPTTCTATTSSATTSTRTHMSTASLVATLGGDDSVVNMAPGYALACSFVASATDCVARDIGLNTNCLAFLRDRMPDVSHKEQHRIRSRCRMYSADQDGFIWRVMLDGHRLRCPEPYLRSGIVHSTLTTNGHYGIRRTLSHLGLDYWWHGMSSDVEGRCKSCEDCGAPSRLATIKYVSGVRLQC